MQITRKKNQNNWIAHILCTFLFFSFNLSDNAKNKRIPQPIKVIKTQITNVKLIFNSSEYTLSIICF
jgi:hypothetical protein